MKFMITDVLNDFAKPSAVMHGAPFWAWNAELKEDELREQIRTMHEMGFGGFFMHSRTGLDTAYLSDEWYQAIGICIDEAEKLGMLAYLYDEDRWPSGAAGGFVTSNDRFKMRKLYCSKKEVPSDALLLASFALRLENNKIISMRKLADNSPLKKNEAKFNFFRRYMDCTSWYNHATYLDTMNAEAVKRFIEVTHQQYADRYGEKFSKSVPAMFTDEPCYIHGDVNGCLPWTDDLCEKFKERFNYDLLDHIPELFFAAELEVSKARHDYYDLIASFFAENFIGQIAEWGEKNQLPLCGHLLGEDALSSQTLYIGSAMRCYEKMQIPGVDVLTEYWNIFNTVKQCASVARQTGKELRMTETYGCTGWDFPFFGHKAIGDWQYALGINTRCLHLTWYSLAGEGKRDYPASFSQHSPWVKEYPTVENYFARLGSVLKNGSEMRDLLVIHPIESLWSVMVKDIPVDSANKANRQIQPGRKVLDTFDSPVVNELDNNHTRLTNLLLSANLDFDFGDEEMLSRLASSTGEIFTVGKADYRQILIPELKTIRSSTLKLLADFKGKVFYLGNPPSFVDALLSNEAEKVFASFIPVNRQNVTSQISADFRRVSIADADNSEAQAVFYRLSDCTDGYTFFIVNTSMEFLPDQKKGIKVRDRNITYDEVTVKLSLPFKGNIAEFNAVDGTYRSIDYSYENGYYIFKTSLGKIESRLFVIAENFAKGTPEPKAVFKNQKTVENCGFDYELSEENILVLDHAMWETAEESSEKPEYIILADDKFRSMIGEAPRGGLMEQPWHRGRKETEKSMKLCLTYTFECDVIPAENCLLSMENPEKFTIYLNDNKVEQNISGFYLDRAIKNLKLCKDFFIKGTNKLVLVCEKYDYFTNLEAVYIRGNFGVDEKSHMTALPEKLFFGDWCQQKLANYAGNITYYIDTDCCTPSKITFPDWRGTLLGVKIDDDAEKLIPFFPFETAVPQGRHRLAITVYGHRRNSFGPFYLNEKWPERTGPYQFKVYEHPERQLVPAGLLGAPVIFEQ